jgi:DNA-binding transcriptional regulator YiaG
MNDDPAERDVGPEATNLRAMLETLGMSQCAFAVLCSRSTRTVRRWVSGREAIPRYVWLVLRAELRFAEATRKQTA